LSVAWPAGATLCWVQESLGSLFAPLSQVWPGTPEMVSPLSAAVTVSAEPSVKVPGPTQSVLVAPVSFRLAAIPAATVANAAPGVVPEFESAPSTAT